MQFYSINNDDDSRSLCLYINHPYHEMITFHTKNNEDEFIVMSSSGPSMLYIDIDKNITFHFCDETGNIIYDIRNASISIFLNYCRWINTSKEDQLLYYMKYRNMFNDLMTLKEFSYISV